MPLVADPKTDTHQAPELRAIYAAHAVGALAGVSGHTVGQWAHYDLIRPTHFKGRPHHLYSFYDAAEAIVIHWLRDRGFSYAAIHNAVDDARQDYRDWPLLRAPLGVAQHALSGDRGLIVLEREKGVYTDTSADRRDELGHSQIAVRPELLDRAADMLRWGGWLAEQHRLRRIEVDPSKLGGTPTVRGHRWPVDRVVQIAADDDGKAILIEDYGLDPRDVDEAEKWVAAAAKL